MENLCTLHCLHKLNQNQRIEKKCNFMQNVCCFYAIGIPLHSFLLQSCVHWLSVKQRENPGEFLTNLNQHWELNGNKNGVTGDSS